VCRKNEKERKEGYGQLVQMPVRDTSKRWSLKIMPSQLIFLKDDPDFLTMVKFGRAINALSFASTVVASSMKDNSNVGRRQLACELILSALGKTIL
jgi:hypothetical protein